MQVDAQIVNAFIDGTAGGNPAGVVLDADTLTTEQKLHIARQLGLSETAFVSSSQSATVKLEFFTPTRQIPHCGHATIATFSLLHKLGVIGEGNFSKESIDGNLDILIAGEMVFMEQRAPQYRTLDAGVGYAGNGRRCAWRAYFAVDNLFDRRYAGSVIVNDANARYYEPAPGRTWLVGFELSPH